MMIELSDNSVISADDGTYSNRLGDIKPKIYAENTEK
jgi:hypothetical protein